LCALQKAKKEANSNEEYMCSAEAASEEYEKE